MRCPNCVNVNGVEGAKDGLGEGEARTVYILLAEIRPLPPNLINDVRGVVKSQPAFSVCVPPQGSLDAHASG